MNSEKIVRYLLKKGINTQIENFNRNKAEDFCRSDTIKHLICQVSPSSPSKKRGEVSIPELNIINLTATVKDLRKELEMKSLELKRLKLGNGMVVDGKDPEDDDAGEYSVSVSSFAGTFVEKKELLKGKDEHEGGNSRSRSRRRGVEDGWRVRAEKAEGEVGRMKEKYHKKTKACLELKNEMNRCSIKCLGLEKEVERQRSKNVVYKEDILRERATNLKLTKRLQVCELNVKEKDRIESVLRKKLEDERILKFEIKHSEIEYVSQIGSGSYGVCWEALWRGTGGGITCVVKEYNLVRAVEQEEMFKEFRLISNLFHPNVIRVFGYAQTKPSAKASAKTCLKIVMEKMDENLYYFVQRNRGKLSLYDKFKLMKKMTQSVHYLHCKGVLHRDIKSFNMLVSHNGNTLRITDFGLCRIISASTSFINSKGKGTVRWMAPEVLEDTSHYSVYSDVYALGITFYEVIFEDIPYNNIDNEMSVIYQVKFKDIRPNLKIPLLNETADRLLKDLLQKMWTKDVKNRPTTTILLEWFDKYEKVFSTI